MSDAIPRRGANSDFEIGLILQSVTINGHRSEIVKRTIDNESTPVESSVRSFWLSWDELSWKYT